jgi:hypothetical protein
MRRKLKMEMILVHERLTRKEAAAYLRISKTTLDKLPIPRVKIRHLVFYRKCDIDNWLAENTQIKEVGK